MITLIKYIIINMINYHTYHNSQLSILNSQLNKLQFTSRRDKHRRLWRPAVATHPPIAETPNASQHRVPMGHVSIRNPLQALKERSCGINYPSHPNLVPQSGTDYHPKHHMGCISPPSGRVFKI